MIRLVAVLLLAALLTGCASNPLKGQLDNVLTITMPAAGAPRAFVNSTWGPLSFGAELREADAEALRAMLVLHLLMVQQQSSQPRGP